jgi:hypothetical protein
LTLEAARIWNFPICVKVGFLQFPKNSKMRQERPAR